MSYADTGEGASLPRLEFSLPFDPARLLRARARLREYLHFLTNDRVYVDDVVLSVMEAANNALWHSAGSGQIRISLAVNGDALDACVHDEGPGFDPSLLRLGEPPDSLSLGGRGLYLMSRLSDDLHFDFSQGCDVHLRKRLPAASSTDALTDGASPESLSDALSERAVDMIEEADEGFAALDWELRCLYVNRAAERMLRRSRLALLGRSLFDILPAVRGTRYEEQFRLALEQGLVAGCEAYYEPLGLWHELRIYPTPFGVAVHFRDITERKRLEAEHEELLTCVEGQRERLRTVLEHLDEGVFVVDREANVVEANAEARRIGGFADRQRGWRIDEWPEIDFVASEGAPLARKDWPVARVARGETFFGCELTVHNRATGEELSALAHGVPVFDQDGRLSLGIVSLRDVTAHRRSEHQKQVQATALRAIADILETALSVADQHTLGWECLRVAQDITNSRAGSLAGTGERDGWSGMIWFHEQEQEALSVAGGVDHAPRDGRNGAMRTLQRAVLASGAALATNVPGEELGLEPGTPAPLAAFLGVPLWRGDELAGALAVADKLGGYTPDDLWLLESLAPVVVQLLDRLEMHNTLQESLARTRVLAGIAAAAAGADRPEDVSEAVLVTAALHLGLKAGAVSVLDEQARVLRRLATFGSAYTAAWVREPIPLDETLNVGRMLLYRLPYMTSDSPEQSEASLARFAGMGLAEDSWVKVPITAGDRVLGAFTLVFDGERTFSSEDLGFYRAVADELGVALQRASYADEREIQAAQLRRSGQLSLVLDAVNDMVRGVDEPRRAIAQAAALAAVAIGADRAVVHLRQKDGWRRLGQAGEPETDAAQPLQFALGEVAQTAREPLAACLLPTDGSPRPETPHRRRDSLFLAPLRAAEELFGAVSFVAPADRAYDDVEVDFVRKLAAALGGALQNMQLFEALSAQLEVSNLLLSSFRVLHEWTDLDTMLSRLAEVLLVSAPGCRVTVAVANEEHGELRVAASCGPGAVTSDLSRVSPPPAAVRTRLTSHSTLLVDLEQHPDCRWGVENHSFMPRFLLAVPVVTHARAFGVLVLEAAAERGSFSAQEVKVVEAIAGQTATAMENARLLNAEVEAQRTATHELETSQLLLMMAGVFAAQTDPQQLFEHIAHTLARSFPGTRTAIAVRDAHGDFEVVAAAGENADPVGTRWAITEYSIPAQRAMAVGRATIIDYDALSGQDASGARARNMHLSIFAPLHTKGRTIGVLGIDRAGSRVEFSDRELRLAQGIADQAAVAVHIASMFEKEREEVRFHEALDEAGRLLHSALDDDTIFAGALELAARTLRVASGVIATRERGRWVVRYQYGFGNDLVGRGWSSEAVPFIVEAARRREPFVIDDVRSRRGRKVAGSSTPPGIRSVLTAPLLTGDDVVGVLVFNKPETSGFSAPEVAFARRLSRSVSLALQNARVFAREHTIAETLQEALLAMPDSVPGFDFAHAYHSAALAARVGGDFYDVFELDEGVLGVVVGDISGKGLDAAVLTSAVKNSLRAQAFEQSKTPGDVLRLVNEVLVRSSAPEIFATVFFGVLDRRAGRLVYCNAGHTAGLVVRAGGELTELPHTAPVVGAFPDLVYTCAETTLSPGDLLFLYTDGLVEARNHGVLFGPEALLQLFSDPALRKPSVAVEQVTAAVLAFADGRLSDDMALLAVAPRP